MSASGCERPRGTRGTGGGGSGEEGAQRGAGGGGGARRGGGGRHLEGNILRAWGRGQILELAQSSKAGGGVLRASGKGGLRDPFRDRGENLLRSLMACAHHPASSPHSGR